MLISAMTLEDGYTILAALREWTMFSMFWFSPTTTRS